MQPPLFHVAKGGDTPLQKFSFFTTACMVTPKPWRKRLMKARSIEDTEVIIKRVPDLVPEDVARKAGAKLDQIVPFATIEELPDYDAIIFGTPTRFGNMCAQMRNFLDRTGRLWLNGNLIGKVGSVFTSTGTQHGGQEATITPFHITLLHLKNRPFPGIPRCGSGKETVSVTTASIGSR